MIYSGQLSQYMFMTDTDKFRRLTLAALISVFFSMILGSASHSINASFLWLDFPLCFGNWLPPIDISHIHKNLQAIPNILVKLWLGYFHHLFGIVTSIFIVIITLRSFQIFRDQITAKLYGILAVLMVIIESIIGFTALHHNNSAFYISLHFFCALFIFCLLIYMRFTANESTAASISVKLKRILIFSSVTFLSLTILQLLLGAQVRDIFDETMKATAELQRNELINHTRALHDIHRSFSWLLLLAVIWSFVKVQKLRAPIIYIRSIGVILLLIGIQMLIGAVLDYAELPVYAQVLHLANAVLLVGAEVQLLLLGAHAETDLKQIRQ